MLKYLKLKNIILVDEATLSFDAGLNILTGETGSGKSAIMHGLSLVIGERSDTSMIRKGCEKGIVEAVFDLDYKDVKDILDKGGIDHESGQDLVIRREISLNGKNRIFINNQSAQLSFLKKIGCFLAQMIGQHANQSLYTVEFHREIIDVYGNLQPLVKKYRLAFERENEIRQKLHKYVSEEALRLRQIDSCLSELEELNEAQVKEGEEEELFNEYTFLVNTEELSEKVGEINQALTGERMPIIPLLNRQKQLLDSIISFDPQLKEVAESFQSVLAEIQEISHTLRNYQSSLHYDADRLYFLNERLALINRLKRKYGSSVSEILAYQKATQEKLRQLENGDLEIDQLKEELVKAETLTNEFAGELTVKRLEVADCFSKELTRELHALNMPKASFEVEVSKHKRMSEGDDRVEFFLLPNTGENRTALKDGASGGEISRVLLALQTLLAGKGGVSSLIFDEVDANIGGETASVIGLKLEKISQKHQVICITHFPQVARCAHFHIQISKEERDGRTVTVVQELNEAGKEKELARMSGNRAGQNIK